MRLATQGLFLYKDTLYKQIDGVTMSCSLGPTLANFFMAHIGKDSSLEGDESAIIVVTGGRPGPSSHCSLSNHQFKIKQ